MRNPAASPACRTQPNPLVRSPKLALTPTNLTRRASCRQAGTFAASLSENRMEQPPKQQQEHQPGRQEKMTPEPKTSEAGAPAAGKLRGKVALITGGDSGIGRAVAIAFAREGADVIISYLEEHTDAHATEKAVPDEHRRCVVIPGDVGNEKHCRDLVAKTSEEFGRLDIRVNNAAVQYPQASLMDISEEQLVKTFR